MVQPEGLSKKAELVRVTAAVGMIAAGMFSGGLGGYEITKSDSDSARSDARAAAASDAGCLALENHLKQSGSGRVVRIDILTHRQVLDCGLQGLVDFDIGPLPLSGKVTDLVVELPSPDQLQQDLLHQTHSAEDPRTGEEVAGIIVGGLIGGAVGAKVGELISALDDRRRRKNNRKRSSTIASA